MTMHKFKKVSESIFKNSICEKLFGFNIDNKFSPLQGNVMYIYVCVSGGKKL